MKNNYLVFLLFLVSFSLSYYISNVAALGLEVYGNSKASRAGVKMENPKKRILMSETMSAEGNGRFLEAWEKGALNDQESISNYFSGKLSMGDLFILDQLFSTSESKVLNPGETTLGDLIIIDKIFSNNPQLLEGGISSLDNLVVLDELFSKDNPRLLSSEITLGDVLILEKVFNK